MIKLAFIFIGAIIATFLFLSLLMQFQLISAKGRKIVVAILIVIFALLGIYTTLQDRNDLQTSSMIQLFLSGENLVCDGLKISRDDFTYISGTQSFRGKDDSSYPKKIIPLSKCKLLNKTSK